VNTTDETDQYFCKHATHENVFNQVLEPPTTTRHSQSFGVFKVSSNSVFQQLADVPEPRCL